MKTRRRYDDDQTLDLFARVRPEVRATPMNDNAQRWPCACDLAHSRFCDGCIDSGRADFGDRLAS